MSDAIEAAQNASHPNQISDRIFVQDFIKSVEIGAFQSERNVTQRIRFNVVLDVKTGTAAQVDDVDLILSYDAITDAIENQLAVERLNLLETLAERIAGEILQHPHALHVLVRIEKLDRIPGSLGIEIQRSKDQISEVTAGTSGKIEPLVVALSQNQLGNRALREWVDALANLEQPTVICPPINPVQPEGTGAKETDRRVGLLSMDQTAWVIAAQSEDLTVVDSRTELDWAMQNGLLTVWAPSRMVLDAVGDDLSAQDHHGLAHWLAQQIGVPKVLLLGAQVAATEEGVLPVSDTQALASLAANGLS